MSTQPRLFDRIVTPEEIEAAVRRAHRERNEAIYRFFSRLFSRLKAGRPIERPALSAAASR